MAKLGGWLVAGVVLVIAIVGSVIFVGCGGVGVKLSEDIRVQPIELAGPVRVEGPIQLDALRIDQTVPIQIQGGVPIQLPGPVTIQIQGPSMAYEGTYISEALMERVQLGNTTGEWILAVIGEPEARTTMADGSEIWKWVYRPTGSQGSLVNLLGQGEGEKPQPQPITAFVRLKDGLVVDKWRG